MMACKASTAPLLRTITTRQYSQALKTASCDNKIHVASLETEAPLARVSILFRAGARYESPAEQGITHGLRIVAGLTTKASSQLAITRNIQKLGASLTATTDRESVTYTLEGTRGAVENSLNFLRDVATQPAFKPWEIKDNLPRIKYEIAGLPDPVRAVELLHRAAFRTGLGNSLFCPKNRVDKIDSEALAEYFSKTITSQRAVVASVGLIHNQVVAFAESLPLKTGEGPVDKSTYYGGEIRRDTGGPLAHVAIGVKGAALKDTKNALAFAVLQQALGTGPAVRWGAGSGALLKAARSAAGDSPVAVTAINAEYSDDGLFGALVSCPGENASKIVKGVASALKSINISDADVKRGKALLKLAVLATSESGRSLVEEIGQQALLLGDIKSPVAMSKEIESITLSDVQSAVSSVKSGKLSMAAVGNLNNVPYLDQL